MLKQELKKTRDEERRQDLKKTIDSLSSRSQARKFKEQSLSKKRELRKEEAAAVKEGKKPFYLKKCNFIV
jgi:ribosomal RNA-processing protein 36